MFLVISLATPSIFPSKAYCLALSRFNSLPVNNSASNSADIESSKFNNPLDMLVLAGAKSESTSNKDLSIYFTNLIY